MSDYTLYNADCLDILPTLEPQSVDAVITDVPSGQTACKWDSVIPFAPMWAGIKRVLRPHGACVLLGCTQPFTSALVMSNPSMFRYALVWDKKISSGYLNAAHRPLARHEDVVIFGSSSVFYYPIMRKGVLRYKGGMKNPSAVWGQHDSTKSFNDDYHPTSIVEINAERNGEHETQKPLDLLEYFVRTYTNEGDTVLDFTMGSGTTGHACGNLGRRFVGIEKDAGYFAIAQERIATAYAPLRHMQVAV